MYCFEMEGTMQNYDLTYGDFNPHLLYIAKRKAMEDGVDHTHDFMELTYVLSGKGKYIIEGEEYIVSGGDLLIGNPGLHHQFLVMDEKEAPVEVYIGVSDLHFVDMPRDSIVLENNQPILHCKSELKQELNQLCQLMAAEYQTRKSGRYYMLRAYLMQMLLLIVREIRDEKEAEQDGYIFESKNKSYIVKKIISYLNENYASHISLDEIARNMYLSPVYISKLFKEETGESPINYLIQIRLDKAKDILLTDNYGSIKSVASAVGYEDVYYFSKLFKKYYGMAPAYYRKQEKKR